jgi:hypothetical protein
LVTRRIDAKPTIWQLILGASAECAVVSVSDGDGKNSGVLVPFSMNSALLHFDKNVSGLGQVAAKGPETADSCVSDAAKVHSARRKRKLHLIPPPGKLEHLL